MSVHSRASSPRTEGSLIGDRYRIEASLGRGGAARVFRVLDTRTGAQVALKQLAAGASAKVVALFEAEYQILAGLKHPAVVEAYDFGLDEGQPFYTMELLEGEDLKERAPIPWREACGYLVDAARGLGLLHARNVVHRDVSPRNLWRLPSGRVKLIDFGAVAPFGPTDHVMGTPPFVPPEALRTRELDQRSDLFALGAVAYLLLTGAHAFPARDLAELETLWQAAPEPPSVLMRELGRADLEAPPAELDTLVLALLSLDPLARPGSTADVIDRLTVLLHARRSVEYQEPVDASILEPAFVGRQVERRRMRRLLRLAVAGRGQSWMIRADSGAGRTRLLRELGLLARIAPATVLHADAASVNGEYGVAGALALQLLDAHPREALEAAAPWAPLLAHASPRLRERLGVVPADREQDLRVRVQAALRDWFLRVAERRTVAILLDNFERSDEGSAAFLHALTVARRRARIVLVYASREHRDRGELSAVERAIASLSYQTTLRGLSESETFDLVRSLFGAQGHVARLAGRLHRATSGNPAHSIELVHELVRREVIARVQGGWLLPQELPDAVLTVTREQALASRLDALPPDLRRLARALSVSDGLIPLRLASALAGLPPLDTERELKRLQREGVLHVARDGVRFAHEPLQRLLAEELEGEARVAAKRAYAEHLLALPECSALERMTAGAGLIEIDDPRGVALVLDNAREIVMQGGHVSSAALRYVEQALTLLHARGHEDYELVPLLSLLTSAGYYVDRRYGLDYGPRTMETLEQLLGIVKARGLRRFLGGKLSILLGLLLGALRMRRLRKRATVVSFREGLFMLFNGVALLTGASIICLDTAAARRYAEVIAPLRALGKRHVASFMHAYCCALADMVRDAYGDVYARWRELMRVLDGGGKIKGLTDGNRMRYRLGALYAMGVLESWRDDERALQAATALESVGLELYQLSAHQVRAVYYANQGALETAEHHRQQAERHAIQQGTIWQVETWATSAAITICLRTHDAMGMKHVSQQLARMSQRIPSLDLAAKRSRGAYLYLRKRYREALPWLEDCLREAPREHVGWARSHGLLAAAYNRLGEYEKARAACARVLGEFTAEDNAFPAMTLLPQAEILVAQAGLGDVDGAKAGLARLSSTHAKNGGPLTMGQLHETGIEIALLGDDRAALERHFDALQRVYAPLAIPTLVQRCELLKARIYGIARGERTQGVGTLESQSSVTQTSQFVIHVDRMLAGGALSFEDRARKALQILAEQARCSRAFFYLLEDGGHPRFVASLGDEQPMPRLEHTVAAVVERELEDIVTQMDGEDDADLGDPSAFQLDDQHLRAFVLSDRGGRPFGAAVVASADAPPPGCSAHVLASIARHLHRAAQGRSTQTSLS